MRSLLPRAAAPPAAPPSAPRRRRPARATPASSAESVEAEATEAAPPPPYYGRRRRVRRDFLRLDFEPVVPPLLDTVLADVHEEARPLSPCVARLRLRLRPRSLALAISLPSHPPQLLAVAMGLNQPELAEAAQAELPPPRAGLQWLPRGQAASSLRDFRGPPPFDLFSLDAEELLGRLGGPPGPELAEQLGRVARRFFVERVYSRSQVHAGACAHAVLPGRLGR